MWYQTLKRTQPYLKNYRRLNLWYDYNNNKHQEIKRLKVLWLQHGLRRMTKHESYERFFLAFCVLPFLLWLNKQKKKYSKPKPADEGTKL
jgi:hypothetical protein